MAWALVIVGAASIGTAAVAVLLAGTAGLATAEVARSRRSGHPPAPLAAAAGAAVIVVAASGGVWPLVGASVLVAVTAPAAVVAGRVRSGSSRRRTAAPLATAGLAIVIGVPLGAVVLIRGTYGATVTLVFLATVLLYDAAVFIVGTGAANRWEGPVAGVLTIVPLTVIVASVLAPPFAGDSAWVLGGVLAVSCPAGAAVATRMAAGRPERVPALGRIDTLLVAAPVWAVAAALLHVG